MAPLREDEGRVVNLEDPQRISEIPVVKVAHGGGEPLDLLAATRLLEAAPRHDDAPRLEETGNGRPVTDRERILPEGSQAPRASVPRQRSPTVRRPGPCRWTMGKVRSKSSSAP